MPRRFDPAELAQRITEGIERPAEKVRAVHDWIVRNTAYDLEGYRRDDIRSVYFRPTGVIDHGMAVCQGYADATKLLLDALGIETLVVHNDDHAWNMVKLEGIWYHLDVTWDDPVPDRPGRVRYEYFLISEARIGRDHDLPSGLPPAPRDWTEAERPVPEPITPAAGPIRRRWFRLYADRTGTSATFLASPSRSDLRLDRAAAKLYFHDLVDLEGDAFYRYFPRDGRPLLEFSFDSLWRAKEAAPDVNRFLRNRDWLGRHATALEIGDRLILFSNRAARPLPELALVVREQ